MYQIAQNFTLRIILSFTVCACLLLLPGISLLSEASHGQSAGKAVRPQHHRLEGSWPNIEDVKNESRVEREAPPPIPSTLRSRKLSEKPWNGRRVGDPETQPPLDGAAASDNKTQRAHARRRMNPAPPPIYEDQFIQNFFSLALLRGATYDETLFWNYQLRAAYNQGQTSLKLAAVELGKTLFESASYAARARDAHWYVYDLYKTFLMRDPDASGWAYWESQVGPNGRENVRRAFEEAPEFATLLSTIVLSGSVGSNPASLITARTDPRNQPGNGMLTRDVNWSVSLLSLPGRNGLDLGLALSYSSMVWTPSGPYLHFDEDNGFPSPGFRLGFPTVQRRIFDAQTAKNAFLLITPGGRRVELRQVGTSNIYEAGDSSYLQLTDNSPNLLVRSTDGTQLSFVEINNEFSCTQVKDRNGNFITVNHNALGRITSITDTLGRVINFNYDSNANLISITQSWNGQPSHQWVSLGWSTRNMQYSFATDKVIGTAAGATLPVVTQVALNDTSSFTFDYTNSLQVSLIKNYFGATERNATSFTYETPSGDVPRLLSSSVSAQNWTGVNGVPAQVTTQYSVAGDGACVMTAPDGTIYKEYYGTGWQTGLATLSEIWSGGVKQKWTTTSWTQDNTGISYETNPRVTETNVYDASGNRRRTVIDYGGNPLYAQYGLPYWVKEYAADGVTEIRHTFTDYNLSQAYLDRRIIGLVSEIHLTNISSYQGKISYSYDDPARLQALPATATQHDSAYNSSFTARGNATSVSRWDFTDIANASKKLTSYTNYFVTGTPASATDPANHQSSLSYADAFSDGLSRNTYAYPTTVTDADGYSSYVQYNFDFGATTRTQSPAPAGQSQGAIQTMAYNSLGQLERVTTTNNGAYKRFWYGSNYVASYATSTT
jgi:YD repeat-containing protein